MPRPDMLHHADFGDTRSKQRQTRARSSEWMMRKTRKV